MTGYQTNHQSLRVRCWYHLVKMVVVVVIIDDGGWCGLVVVGSKIKQGGAVNEE